MSKFIQAFGSHTYTHPLSLSLKAVEKPTIMLYNG